MTPFRFPLGAHVRWSWAPPGHPGYIVQRRRITEAPVSEWAEYGLVEVGVPGVWLVWAYEPDLEAMP